MNKIKISKDTLDYITTKVVECFLTNSETCPYSNMKLALTKYIFDCFDDTIWYSSTKDIPSEYIDKDILIRGFNGISYEYTIGYLDSEKNICYYHEDDKIYFSTLKVEFKFTSSIE